MATPGTGFTGPFDVYNPFDGYSYGDGHWLVPSRDPFQTQQLIGYEPCNAIDGNINQPAYEDLWTQFFPMSHDIAQPTGSEALVKPANCFYPETSNAVASSSILALNVPESTSSASPAKLECALCTRTFDRTSRAEACFNTHLGARPHQCRGACGNEKCNASYASAETLRRHIRPVLVQCPTCRKTLLKQNSARHNSTCRRNR